MGQVTACGALLLLLAACGGGEPVTPAAPAADAEAPGDAPGVVSGDLDVPDWLPSPFTLPERLQIRQVTEDPPSQQASLYGVVRDGDVTEILDLMASGLPADGFERVTDGTEPLVFLKDGVGRVRVYVSQLGTSDGEDVELRVDIDTWSDEQIAQFRDDTAEDVRSTGSVVATIDGTTYEVSGECVVGGRTYIFASADNPSMSVSIDERTDPPSIYADLYDSSGDERLLYVPADTGSLAWEVTSPTAPAAFSVSGEVVQQDVDEEPLDAVFDVACAGPG